ncbi:MAG TPA: hypothetical protein VL307_03120, partial [Chitinophagaceae bacterium]|nr:hypothetical protein [Chitinophagaceae bacterium]
LFNGIEYLRSSHGVQGTPFFLADSFFTGNVYYDGHLYERIPLHYDLVTDDVITQNYAQNNELKLVPEKLQYFSLQDHFFVRITTDSTLPDFIKTGFYEQLYDGKMTVLAHHEKLARQFGAAADNTLRYTEYNSYYVLLKGVFYRADNKSDFLSLAGAQKDALKKYMKANKLQFKKNKEADMVKTAAYFSQLTN